MGNWDNDPRGWRLSRRGFMKGATALAGTAAAASVLPKAGQAQENTVVNDNTVFVQHQAITTGTRFQGPGIINVETR